MADIFNKEALEALDAKSEAEEMARVASPKLKLVLGALLAMVVVAVYWCAFGTINDKVTAQGIIFPFGEVKAVNDSAIGANDRVIDTIRLYIYGDMDKKTALNRLAEHQPNHQITILSQTLADKYLRFVESIEL